MLLACPTLFLGLWGGLMGTYIFSSRGRPLSLVRTQNAMPSSQAEMSSPSGRSYQSPFLRGRTWRSSGSSIFLFRDAASDTDQQLLAGEGQWIYSLEGDQYYQPESKRHYPSAFFQSVKMSRFMRWGISQSTELVHVGALTLHGFTRSGPPHSVVGLHPGNVIEKRPWGRFLPKLQLSWTNSWRRG